MLSFSLSSRLTIFLFVFATSLGLGGAGFCLALFGFLKKQRPRLKQGILCIVLSVLLIAGMAGYAAVKVYRRVSAVTWAGTDTRPLSLEEWLSYLYRTPTPAPKEIRDFQVAESETVFLSWHCVRYRADKAFVLGMVASTPAEACSIHSDAVCVPIPWGEWARERFKLHSAVPKDVPFWRPDEIQDAECYECMRFPWQHFLLFDRISDTVYHVVMECRE